MSNPKHPYNIINYSCLRFGLIFTHALKALWNTHRRQVIFLDHQELLTAFFGYIEEENLSATLIAFNTFL
ncbi:hypothetical protein L6452_18353 [Arctium lappa]|uniref:Uncharacterized protein n=1 Tax=Arctium lappa TaxID=4217 RepID=A0ACB9C636_ARCLA|nr:hypothetical protein L6452_18353 [Arctium lappa]